MVKDALKFFHAYINEMIDLGGENLPRAISTKLGAKLGTLYKERGINQNIETALNRSYKVLGANPSIKKIDEHTYDITIKHRNKFCPIGGKTNPPQAKIIQENICYPYTRSFLTKLFPEFQFEAEIKQCIVANNSKYCRYILQLQEKENFNHY